MKTQTTGMLAVFLVLLAQGSALELVSKSKLLVQEPDVGALASQLLNMFNAEADIIPVANVTLNGTVEINDQTVDSIGQALAKLKKTGKATPEMARFVKTVNNMINLDMVPKILAGHKKGVKQLKTLMDAFGKCKGTRSTSMAKLKKNKSLMYQQTRKHKRCRRKQQVMYKHKYDCSQLVRTKYQLYRSDCQKQKLLMRNPNTEANYCHAARSERYGNWLRRNSRWFSSKDGVYSFAKKRCDLARADYLREKPKCDKKIKLWKTERSICDADQKALEGNTCTLGGGLMSTCKEYRQCHRSAMMALSRQEPNIRKMAKDRKGEWRALKRIQCLLGVFADEEGEVNADVMNKCRRKTHSTAHLVIRFPRVPPRLRCEASPPIPCSAPYYNMHYRHLPRNSRARSCTQCVIRGASGLGAEPHLWLTAENFIPKTKTWLNKGTGGDVQNVVLSGTARLNLDAGNGAKNRLVAVTGSYRTVMNFGNVVPRIYTICSLTRYTSKNRHYQKRILNGNGRNWLHGHWMGRAGAVFYSGWKAGWSRTTVNPNTNWVAACGKNRGRRPMNVLINGRPRGRYTGGWNPPRGLMINAGVYGNEKSDFAIHELMVWDVPLTDYHMSKAMRYLMKKLNQKISKAEQARRKQIVNQKIKPTYWLDAANWDPISGGWKNKGTAKHLKNIVVRGKLGMMLESGYGASSKMLSVTGNKNTWLNFGNLFSRTYTICSITRYTSKNRWGKGRILTSRRVNWLHGHWYGRAGAAYYRGWKAGWARSTVNPNTNWVAMCSSNDMAAPYNVIVNGRPTGIHQGGYKPDAMVVNMSPWRRHENSYFAINEIKIWPMALSKYHMQLEMKRMMTKMAKSTSAKNNIKWAAKVRAANKKGTKR